MCVFFYEWLIREAKECQQALNYDVQDYISHEWLKQKLGPKGRLLVGTLAPLPFIPSLGGNDLGLRRRVGGREEGRVRLSYSRLLSTKGEG